MKKQYSYGSKKVYSMNEMDISKEKLEQLRELFRERKESNDYISLYNAVVVMKEMGFNINEEKKLEIVKYVNQPFFRLDTLKRLYNYLSNSQKLDDDAGNSNSDYADAFIAVGGDEELQGTIQLDDVKKIFCSFHLEMSIDSLLEKSDLKGASEVDFKTFCRLFSDTSVEDSKSLFSLISVGGS